jgi:hypothetical protein
MSLSSPIMDSGGVHSVQRQTPWWVGDFVKSFYRPKPEDKLRQKLLIADGSDKGRAGESSV